MKDEENQDFIDEISLEAKRMKEILKTLSSKDLQPGINTEDLQALQVYLEKNLEMMLQAKREAGIQDKPGQMFYFQESVDMSKSQERFIKNMQKLSEEIQVVQEKFERFLKEGEENKDSEKSTSKPDVDDKLPPSPKVKKKKLRGLGGPGGIKA